MTLIFFRRFSFKKIFFLGNRHSEHGVLSRTKCSSKQIQVEADFVKEAKFESDGVLIALNGATVR